MRLCSLSRLKSGQLWLSVVLLMLFLIYCFHQSRPRREYSNAAERRIKLSSNLDEIVQQSADLQLRPARGGLQRHHRSKHLNRYILSLNYWEQFTMATVNLFGLVCLGKLWNATTVQPFTFNSRLYGLRNLKPDDNFNRSSLAHPLGLIYNMKSLNRVLQRKKFSPLSNFDSFLRYSSRNVVVVHYISPREARELPVMKGDVGETIERGFSKNYIINCREHLSDYLQMLEEAMNSEVSSKSNSVPPMGEFRIIKYWCINMTYASTPQESAAKMGIDEEADVTIVVVNWRGLGSKQVIKGSVKGMHVNNRVAMFNSCKHYSFNNWRNLINYSPPVLTAAERFQESLGLGKDEQYAVVHIRSEKLGIREPRLPRVTAACFEELMRLTNSLAHKHPKMRFVYITDYGPFSSDTCKKCRGSKDVKRYLHKMHITPVYFDPSHFNMTNDTGLAAAVESQFMSSASYLFLCGGGGYQNQIAARFQELRRHRSSSATRSGSGILRIYRVCNDDNEIVALLKKKFG